MANLPLYIELVARSMGIILRLIFSNSLVPGSDKNQTAILASCGYSSELYDLLTEQISHSPFLVNGVRGPLSVNSYTEQIVQVLTS